MALSFMTDVSKYQPSAYTDVYLTTDSYGRRLASFKCADGLSVVDSKFAANLAWCKKAYAAGQIDAFTIYFPYEVYPAAQICAYWMGLLGGTVPAGAALYIDMESWGGKIRGDQSANANLLYGLLAGKAASFSRVLGYGNKSDLATLWAKRDPRCRVIVASYGTKIVFTSVSGAIGQQYTNGTVKGPAGYPTSSKPFGPCDHNVFQMSSQAFAQLVGVASGGGYDMEDAGAHPITGDDWMTQPISDANLTAIKSVVNSELRSLFNGTVGGTNNGELFNRVMFADENAINAKLGDIAGAVIAKLPPAADGTPGYTLDQLTAAFKAVINSAHLETA